MKLIITPNEDHRFCHEEEDIAQNPKEMANWSRCEKEAGFIYQVFRGLSCRFGISCDYHIFVCGSGCHKFDLVISFTAVAVHPSERKGRSEERAEEEWEKEMNPGLWCTRGPSGRSRRWRRRWRIPEYATKDRDTNHRMSPMMYIPFLSPSPVCINFISL